MIMNPTQNSNDKNGSIFWMLMIFMIFVCSLSQAQNTDAKVGKALLRVLKKQSVDFPEQINVVEETIEANIYPTGDSLLIKDANDYLMFLKSKPIVLSWDVDLEKLNDLDKKIFRINHDKFNKSVTIEHKKIAYGYPIDLNILVDKTKAYLILSLNYYGDEWVFMENVQFLINEEPDKVIVSNPERKVVSGGVHEWEYVYVRDNEYKIIKDIANKPDETLIRFNGKYRRDGRIHHKLNPKLLEILNALEYLAK